MTRFYCWWWFSLFWFVVGGTRIKYGVALSAPSTSRPIRVCYAGLQSRFPAYCAALEPACTAASLTVVSVDLFPKEDPSLYDYLLYHPNAEHPVQNWDEWTNLRAVFSLRAGVDGLIASTDDNKQQNDNKDIMRPPRHIPITRMIDPGLQEGMVEYVVGHVLRYHLNTDHHWQHTRQGQWNRPDIPSAGKLARQRTVGILGVGALGGACAKALAALNFQVVGWSRRPRSESDNKIQYYYGEERLYQDVLPHCDILVLLLPSTTATHHLFNRETFGRCKPGVALINVGRGDVLDEAALVDAIEEGQVVGATLDVFDTEPLPPDHPFWHCRNILITPHIAAKSRPETAAIVIAENIRRSECGEPLLYRVNPDAGY